MLKKQYMKKTFKLQSKKTNWTKFIDSLTSNYETFDLNFYLQSPKDKYHHFVKIVTYAIKISTPRKNTHSKRKIQNNPVVWGTKIVKELKGLEMLPIENRNTQISSQT